MDTIKREKRKANLKSNKGLNPIGPIEAINTVDPKSARLICLAIGIGKVEGKVVHGGIDLGLQLIHQHVLLPSRTVVVVIKGNVRDIFLEAGALVVQLEHCARTE